MSRCLRLSKSEFARLSRVNPVFSGVSIAIPGHSNDNSRPAARIIRAVATAVPGIRKRSGAIELRFDGARLATLNDLFAMTVAERRRYRRAWHKLMHDAAIAEFGGPPPSFPSVGITVTRFGPREIDRDAIVPKAPIDGLRYSGFIPEDTPAVVHTLTLRQAIGDYAVVIGLSRPGKREAN